MGKLKSFRSFLIQTRNELRKVRWLKRRELTQHTLTVIIFVLLTTLFLAGADYVIVKALSFFNL